MIVKSSLACALAAAVVAGPALAGPATLTDNVFNETPQGLKPAAKISPGDHVVYVLIYHNGGSKAADAVVITNPLPQGMEYTGPRDGAPPEVSLDGGKTFGPLAGQTIAKAGGPAPAVMGDVTTLRWKLAQAVPAGGDAKVSFTAKLK